MPSLELKPTHKPIQHFYSALRQFDDLGVSHEGAVKSAFHGLRDHCARQHDWTLVPEWEYIVRLLGQVITVSLETVKLVKALPPLETTGSREVSATFT